MKGLQRISSPDEVRQFVSLWSMVNNVSLTDQPDAIAWRFTAHGRYTASSAYDVQFIGSYADLDWQSVRSAQAENKCRFFCWLLLQNKLWKVDRLWGSDGNTDVICKLCRSQPESALHMVAVCPYSLVVWRGLEQWIGRTHQPPPSRNFTRLKSWWEAWTTGVNRDLLQKVVYTMWNLWKERCRRVFQNKAMTSDQLMQQIKNDVLQWNVAWRGLGPEETYLLIWGGGGRTFS
jgi:hypothetical protein